HFKQINDTFGHAAGDQALQIIATKISDNIRENDIASRWGGEEFTVIFPGTTRQGAHTTAEKIRASIEGATIGTDTTITCSVGIAELDLSESHERLLKRLDQALYEAKANGRNCIR
ncbi:MAG: GGDEF domain-containing protein, partial [Pseudomonadales bacterium]|nr:GGDEF domain-containing protein [Pseudomonadales bacterium]